MRVDLHCHSTCSDGVLTPKQLLKKAQENNIQLFSITDHDNINAYSQLPQVDSSIKIISGIEFSTSWNKIGIHIVALNFDLNSEQILKTIKIQQQARTTRAKIISKKLEKFGLKHAYEILSATGKKQIGRPDFAQLLVQQGVSKNVPQAFKKILGAGKCGDVKNQWQDMHAIIESINLSGGSPVLAHPLKYKMSNSKLRRLIKDFKDCGGQALEVLSGFQNLEQINYMVRCCNKYNLSASIGSDFHCESRWSQLGCESAIIKNCDFVWQDF